MSSSTITDTSAKDKRLAARYSAGASIVSLARLEHCSSEVMRARLIAAGATIRPGGGRWV